MAYGIQSPVELATIISQMSYGGLSEVADALVQMNAEGQRDVATVTGMAQTLWDWADATVEAHNEECRQREATKAARAAEAKAA